VDQRPVLQVRTQAVSFTLTENGISTTHESTGSTVGDALAQAGVKLNSADTVTPSLLSTLTPGLHVYVRYAQHLVVRTGGVDSDLYTQASTIGQALTDAGLAQDGDVVVPERATAVRNNMVVGLTTIRDVKESKDTPIAYDTVYKYDANMASGTQKVTQAGADGYLRQEFIVKWINGMEVERQSLGETTVQPTQEVVTIGTKQQTAPPPAPNASAPDGSQCWQTVTVWSTYYTAASAGGSRTATGTGVYKGIVAVDPRYIPLGTRMYVPGYGYALAADTGGGVKGYWLDVAYGEGEAIDWYSHYVDICILG
jgi:uncharacterized protein YabE (DUF348 family)